MTSKNHTLSLAKITPQTEDKPAFDLGDRLIYFRLSAEFGAFDQAKMSQLNRKIQKTSQALIDKPEDEAIQERYTSLYGEFVKLLLPDLPDDVLKSLAMGQRTQIVSWWTKENQAWNDKLGIGGVGTGEV